MNFEKLISNSVNFQWNFFERTINNYSIIMRIMNCVEEGDGLVENIPRVFVEESFFDMCKITKEENGATREGFFSIDGSRDGIDIEAVVSFNGGAASPSLLKNVLGYGILYVYPLKKNLDTLGFLLLGKKRYTEVDARFLTELEMVCEIFNKCLLFGPTGQKKKKGTPKKNAYESMVDQFPDSVMLIDKNGSIVFANSRAKKEFRGRKGLLIGEKIENVFFGIPDDFHERDDVLQGEVNCKSGDGFKIYRIESYTINKEQEKTSYKAVVLKDVVDKKIEEEENSFKGKMESMGMLAGTIAHDFNNLLTGVLGYASLIKNFLKTEEKLYRYAEAIENSARRAAKLTQHLLNFSRRYKKSIGAIDLNALLEDILFLIKENFKDIRIEKNFDDLLPPIEGSEAELQNVFLNLLMNAKDAMEGKGLLRVTTCRKEVGDQKYALIEIQDTGHGIEEKLKTKVFKPYFSTKESGSNLGMGLYLVDKAIKKHKGFLELESEKGKGTKFSLYIPLSVHPACKIEAVEEEAQKSFSLKKQKVLVVDDEDMIRRLVRGILVDKGVEVLEASDGIKAIDIVRKHKDDIDLVILDIIMPGLKGDEVLKTIRNIRKDMKVIISSGFMSEEQKGRLKKYNINEFLDKPFGDTEVIRSIMNALSYQS